MSLTLGQNFSIWEPLVPNVEQCETSFNNPVGSKNFSKFFKLCILTWLKKIIDHSTNRPEIPPYQLDFQLLLQTHQCLRGWLRCYLSEAT